MRSCGAASGRPAGPDGGGRSSALPSASVSWPWSLLEGDVVVGGGRELGVGLLARRCEGLLAATVAAPAEELHGVGDHFHGLALGAVLRLPLPPLEAAVDGHRAALREVLRAVLALVAPDGDVEVVRLLRPFARRAVLAPRVDGETEAADGSAAGCVAELRIPREVSDEHDAIDVGHGYSSPSVSAASSSPGPAADSAYSAGASATGAAADVSPRRCGRGRRVAMWRMTPSVIFRMREISSSAVGSHVKVSRW